MPSTFLIASPAFHLILTKSFTREEHFAENPTLCRNKNWQRSETDWIPMY